MSTNLTRRSFLIGGVFTIGVFLVPPRTPPGRDKRTPTVPATRTPTATVVPTVTSTPAPLVTVLLLWIEANPNSLEEWIEIDDFG